MEDKEIQAKMDRKTEESLKEFAAPLLKNNKKVIVKALKGHKNNTNNSNNSFNYDNNNSNKNRSGFLSNSSTYSILPISEVTQGAVDIWATLPDEIREDPSLASFRQEHERIHGKHFEFLVNFVSLVWLVPSSNIQRTFIFPDSRSIEQRRMTVNIMICVWCLVIFTADNSNI